jgi:hypothetical protein
MMISSTNTNAAVAKSRVPLMSLKTSTASEAKPAGPVTLASRPPGSEPSSALISSGVSVTRSSASPLASSGTVIAVVSSAVAPSPEIRAGRVVATVFGRSALISARTRSLMRTRTRSTAARSSPVRPPSR